MDDTLLPGAEAIYNVSIALKRVQDDLAMKNEEIAGLREKNKELELEVSFDVLACFSTCWFLSGVAWLGTHTFLRPALTDR